MKWTDTDEIANALAQKFTDIDPKVVRHMQLKSWVLELNQFRDDPESSNESILKEIQTKWVAVVAAD